MQCICNGITEFWNSIPNIRPSFPPTLSLSLCPSKLTPYTVLFNAFSKIYIECWCYINVIRPILCFKSFRSVCPILRHFSRCWIFVTTWSFGEYCDIHMKILLLYDVLWTVFLKFSFIKYSRQEMYYILEVISD
jgi:hypothetical protein